MPTYVRIAYREPRGQSFPADLTAASIFMLIGLIQLAVAILADGQWAAFGEQSLWAQLEIAMRGP